MFHKVNIDKNYLLIAYKLLIDSLSIALAFFLLALIAEGILPGIITNHVGFSKIVAFIGFALIGSYFLARIAGISFERKMPNKKAAVLMLLIIVLLIFNSLFKISIFLSLPILIVTLVSFYFIYRVVIEDEE